MNNLTKNIILSPFNILYKFNPELTLQILFRLKVGYKLDLSNPKTFNEKLQWLKINDKNELKPICCDKYQVRKYVEEKGAGNILTNLYWTGFIADEIPFEKLPSKFVIKVTHGSTFNIICKDKEKLDIEKTKFLLNKWLKTKFLKCYGEWYYGLEKPRIIIEEYLENDLGKQLDDYKVFCFNGEPHLIRVDSGRFTDEHSKDVYTTEWEFISEMTMGYKNSKNKISKPECLDEILNYARKLSEDFLHARVDFYIVKGKIYFGEITFANGAGFDKIKPYKYDIYLGEKLKLS